MSASSKITHPALYRARQFFAAVKALLLAQGDLTPTDEALVNSILTTSAQQRLFARMSANDQRHALAVGRTLQQAGYNQPALLQAALLHDVAKSLGQPILHRVAIVLLKAFWPGLLKRISGPTQQRTASERIAKNEWRFILHSSSFILHPFVIHAHHPAIGAAWAKEAGSDPLAVRLIARHQETLVGQPDSEEDKLLAVLQWADDMN